MCRKVSTLFAPRATDTTAATTYNAYEGNSTGTVVLATFSDANPQATASDYTVAVNWNGAESGTTSDSVQLVNRTATASTWQIVGSATYAEPGSHTISVQVTDVAAGFRGVLPAADLIRLVGDAYEARQPQVAWPG